MLKNRIIPCLDVKNGRVVKGINFVDLVDAGDPVEQAKIYDDQGADELCFLDITASNENRNIILDTVKKTAEKCFVPLTVGGGVRTIEDTVELSSKTKIPLVISGGVSSLEDIKKIKSLSNSNIEGVIIGKSIYDGDIKINDLAKLIPLTTLPFFTSKQGIILFFNILN